MAGWNPAFCQLREYLDPNDEVTPFSKTPFVNWIQGPENHGLMEKSMRRPMK